LRRVGWSTEIRIPRNFAFFWPFDWIFRRRFRFFPAGASVYELTAALGSHLLARSSIASGWEFSEMGRDIASGSATPVS